LRTKSIIKRHIQEDENEKTELNITKKKAGNMVTFLKTPLSLRALFQPIAISKLIARSKTEDQIGCCRKKEANEEKSGWSEPNEGSRTIIKSNTKKTTAVTKNAIYAEGRFVFSVFISIFLRMF
jgi:hypothetical protein